MTEAQIAIVKKALLEIEQERQKNIDSLNKVEPNYSEKYNKAISRLLKDQREKESSALHLTYRQRIALLIATVLLTALTITACANDEAIKEFVVEIIDHYARLTTPPQTVLFVPCEVTYVPEGYNLEEELIVEDVFITKTWKNAESQITYDQAPTNTSISIDKDYRIIFIDDQEIYLTQSEYSYTLVWINDYGSFNLICSTSIPWEEVEAIFRSITPIEEAPADPE
jgi:hypothetical protein